MNLKSLLPKRFRSDHITIPVVRMSGAIMAGTSPLRTSLNLSTVAGPLQKAFSTKGPAVAISINSPGGSPVQSRLIYKRIRDLAKEKKKHVHVFCEDAAASGGYMIACAGDDITADPSSIVGSIGVISASFGFEKAIEKLGVERRLYTAGQNKSVLDPFKPAKDEDIERLKQLQLDIHATFIDLVKNARGDRLSDDPDIFTGLFWTGERAADLGLVDAVGDMRSVLKAKYGEKTKMQLIEAKRGLFGRRSMFGIENIGAVAAERLIGEADARALWSRIGL